MAKYHDSGTICNAKGRAAGGRACPLGLSDSDHIEASSEAEFQAKLAERLEKERFSNLSVGKSPAKKPNWLNVDVVSDWNGDEEGWWSNGVYYNLNNFEESTVTVRDFAEKTGATEEETIALFGLEEGFSPDQPLGDAGFSTFEVAYHQKIIEPLGSER